MTPKQVLILNGAEMMLRLAMEHYATITGAKRVRATFSIYDDKKSPCQFDFEVTNPKTPGVYPKRPKGDPATRAP